jgi:hypothetical protein
MSGALILLWLGTAASLKAHEPDLEGWAQSRERRIEEPLSEPELPPARHDDALAEHIEALLAEARTQAYSSDTAGAEAALDSAEKLVQTSSELPESAWLMAEILNERASVVGARDASLATDLERRADLLAGRRAAPFVAAAPVAPLAKGARKSATLTDASAPLAAPASPSVTLDGPLLTDDVAVDGVEVLPPRTIPDGAHHVRVLRGGRLAWAGWLTVAGTDVNLAVAQPLPCSTTDLSPAVLGGERRSVLCDDYAMAREVGSERIEVALCHQASCGPFLPWSRGWGASFEGPMHPPPKPHSTSAWVLWTAGGVAAVIIGGFVLAEEGAFERRGPTQKTFTFEPPK